MENVVNLQQLQTYVNENDALHAALGIASGVSLVLEPFAQGEYNANYVFKVNASSLLPRPVHDTLQPSREMHVEHGGGSSASADTFLLRVNLGSQMHLDNQIEYECAALRILEPSGRVPRVFYVDGSLAHVPYGVAVEQFLPGRPLSYETDLAQAAAILADIHAVSVPQDCLLLVPEHPIAAIVDECERMFAVYRAWAHADAGLIARIDALFTKARSIAERDCQRAPSAGMHVVNTEVNSSNFLINSDAKSYLIDWEKPVRGEVEQDLAHFLVPTTTYWKTDTRFTRADVEGFVDLYTQAVDGRFALDGLDERIRDYLVVTCLRGLTWCAMAYTEYASGTRAAFNSDTFAKIKEYIGDEFLTFVQQEYYE